MTECFFIVPANRTRLSLRRYSHTHDCPGRPGYHNADGPAIDVVPDRIEHGAWTARAPDDWPHDDPRWPAKCDGCDYRFLDADEWQVFRDPIYVHEPTGAEYSLRDKRAGMMWDAFWMPEAYRGPDGRCLNVVCPDGREWMIDGPAKNCTEPSDRGAYGVAHRCWTRTGEPPVLTVGKGYGKTCGAGGGSIDTGGYHGFLQNGRFT